MPWRSGAGYGECAQTVEEAAWRVCLALDDNPSAQWQWCGPAEQTFEGTRVVSFNEGAGTAVLRMHCDGSYLNCGSGFDSATGRNITFTFKACEPRQDWAAYLEPAFDGFELALFVLLGAAWLLKLFRRRQEWAM